jgi:hypothetical protein
MTNLSPARPLPKSLPATTSGDYRTRLGRALTIPGAETTDADPDLAFIVAYSHDLPYTVWAGIVAMVKATDSSR